MKSSVIIKSVSVLLACAVSFTAMTACSPVSLLMKKDETTKAAYDEQSLNEKYSTAPTTVTETTVEENSEVTQDDVTTALATSGKETTTAASSDETESDTNAVTELTSALSTSVEITKTIVKTENETKETKTDLKYGVKKVNVVSTYYDVYSDGTKVKNTEKSKTYVKYDYSGFKATTSEMLDEAKANVTTYSSQTAAAVAAVNAMRTTSLTLDSNLCTAASVRAVEMAYSGKVSGINRPNGSAWSTVLTDLGITASSTAIDFVCNGYSGGTAAVNAIKASGSNESKLKNETYKKIGVGFAANPEGTIYCCIIITE